MAAEPLHTPANSEEGPSPKARMAAFTHAEGLGMVMAHNHQGVHHLRSGKHEEALAELITAKDILVELEAENVLPATSSSATARHEHSFDSARAVTASNMGIYHKRMCKYPEAVRCLYAAIRWHEAFGTTGRTLAASHVNLSECLLEAKLPEVALKHARTAADLAGQLIAQGSGGAAARPPSQDQVGVTANMVAAELGLDDYAMLAIAYHKVAEAEEMLGHWSSAAFAYTRAHAVLTWSLGVDDPLTKSFEQSTRCPKRVVVPAPRDPGPLRSGAIKQQRLPRIPASARGGHTWQPARQETWRYTLDKDVLPTWPPRPASREEKSWYRMAQRHQDTVRATELEALHSSCNAATRGATPRMSELPL
mmetsp:Transcript_3675/g.8020  ORF Transcript_3675/g.8020 Transcript_3675/m.8020 type:complete len:365 (+) Transcript_3675:102-1196(+)